MRHNRSRDPQRAGSGFLAAALLLGIALLAFRGPVLAAEDGATSAPAAPVSAAADAAGTVLVWWTGQPPSDDPAWVTLQGLNGSAIGVLPTGSARLADRRARLLEPYNESSLYVLVSHPIYASLQPIPSLAQDDAQILIRLPESRRAFLEEPGCRAQRLSTPVQVRAAREAAARRGGALSASAAVPRGLEAPDRQPPEFWQAMTQAVNADRLFEDIDYLATTLATRYSYTPQMTLACQYARDEFAALGLETWLDPFFYSGHQLTNVVGAKRGTVDPTRLYVVCGHLDSISPTPTTLAPGAEDNGSGSVAVLEAARLLAPLRTDYTIYFICFSAEEQGLVGSEHFAQLADLRNLDIRGVLNLDMVAYYEPAEYELWVEGFHHGATSDWLMELLQANAETYAGLSVYWYPGDGWGSDHEPFHAHGFPAVLSIDYSWDSYPCYHRTCDTVDRLNRNLWRRIVAANVVSAAQLAVVSDTLGWIDGTVTLSDGEDPSGVALRLTGTTYPNLLSDAQGLFGWPAMLPGGYTLIAEKAGYVPDTTEVEVRSGMATPVTIVLHLIGESGIQAEADRGVRGVSLRVSPAPVVAGAAISLRLAGARTGSLAIYGPDGRRVIDLQPSATLAGGEHAFAWDGRDAGGRSVPAGIYWVRWEDREGRTSRGLVVAR